MNDSKKNEYDLFVRSTAQYSVFMESWWLDSTTNESWDFVAIRNSEEKLKAVMPIYLTKNKFGLRSMRMPPCTQYMGIAIIGSNGKYATKLSDEIKYLEGITASIPSVSSVEVNLSPLNINLLPFDWQKFLKSYSYTYLIEDLSPEKVFGGMKESIRTEIRKASKILFFKSGLPPEKFWRLYSDNYKRQKKSTPYSFETFQRIHKRAFAEKSGEIYYAINEFSEIHSAIFVVWDRDTAYYIAGASDINFRNSGANAFIIFECIKRFEGKLKKFDFCGSSVRNIESFFRHFGAIQKPIPQLYKRTLFGSLYLKVIQLIMQVKSNGFGRNVA